MASRLSRLRRQTPRPAGDRSIRDLVVLGLLGQEIPKPVKRGELRFHHWGVEARRRSIGLDHVTPTASNVDAIIRKYVPEVLEL